jgi:deazaflavin-dependent oxidoreductase (nitroreductase family)
MPIEGTYEPSTREFSRAQVTLYEMSGGIDGTTRRGVPCIILWTRGRKTGTVRKTPLMKVEHDGRYAVVASMGGAPKHPVWYLNLMADPNVTVQDGPDVRDFVAREVSGVERADWWRRAVEVWPDYDHYRTRTEREIPVVVLEPR